MAERRRRPRVRTNAAGPPGAAPARRRSLSEVETLARWQVRMSHAKKLREDWETQYHIRRLEEFYLGQQVPETGSPDQFPLWLNHFFATLQVLTPSLLPQEIRFLVESRPGAQPMDRLQARIQAGLLQAIADQDQHLQEQATLALAQAFFRVGVLKVSYEPRMEPNPSKGQPLLNALEEVLQSPDGAQLMEPDELLTDEVYEWRWVNAAMMFLPDEGPSMRHWSWIAEQVEVTLDEAKTDERFPRSLRSQLVANAMAGEPDRSIGRLSLDVETRERELGRFRYYEAWDVAEKRWYCWAEGQPFDQFLVDEPTPAGIESHPYALLAFVPVTAPNPSPWPKPFVFDWLPMQAEYNILREQQLNAAKHAARKVLYQNDTFPDSEEARKALQSPVDMEAAMVNDLARPPMVFGDVPSSPDLWRNIPLLLNDWQRITGSSGTRLGAPDADSATEAVLIEQAAGVRESSVQGLVRRWLGEAGRKMQQLLRQTLTLEMWVQLRDLNDRDFQEFIQSPGLRGYLGMRLGPENVPQFLEALAVMPGMQEQLRERFGQLKPLKVSRSELQFEADVKVMPSTAKPLHRAGLLQVAKLLGPMALMSPTLLEEVLLSFDMPKGEEIAQEILVNMQKMQQAQQQPKGPRAVGGNGAASPLGPSGMNPLSVVSGMGGLS